METLEGVPADREKHIKTTDARYKAYGRRTADEWEGYPTGLLSALNAFTDCKLTNPETGGLGYVMDVAIRFAEENGRTPDRDELRDAYMDREVEIDGETKIAGNHMMEMIQEEGKQFHAVCAYGAGAEDPDVGDVQETTLLLRDYVYDKLFRSTSEASDGEWKAVNAMEEEFATDPSETLRTDKQLRDAGLGGEQAGIDAAIMVDGEYVTLQVKPAGMPDGKGNADYTVHYEANGKIAGDMTITAEEN